MEFARAGDFDYFLLAGRYTLLEQAAAERVGNDSFFACRKRPQENAVSQQSLVGRPAVVGQRSSLWSVGARSTRVRWYKELL